jgi:uncharacterized membrane protein YfcA
VLHVPNPALTPTNLLYNVVATPGALLRFRRRAALLSPLAGALLRGTIPGVVCGAVLRVTVLEQLSVFLVVVALVLAPLGAWLLLAGRAPAGEPGSAPRLSHGRAGAIAFVAGLIGGVYGIGGGSLIAPALALAGYAIATVAPAALVSTFVTSLVGAITFQVLELLSGDAAIAPEWGLGVAMGIGGLCGGYIGAHLQPRVPEAALRRLLGAVCLLLAVRYGLQAAAWAEG